MTHNAVQTAWQANLRVNEVVLEHLTPEMLHARTPGGGYSVAQHLGHIVWSTKYWGSKLDKNMGELPNLFTLREGLDEDDQEAYVPETDLARIRQVLVQTAAAAQEAEAGKNAPEEVRWEPPHPSTDAFLIHMMVHDAHHRGQVLLALKTAGFALPDEDLMWGPWRGE